MFYLAGMSISDRCVQRPVSSLVSAAFLAWDEVEFHAKNLQKLLFHWISCDKEPGSNACD